MANNDLKEEDKGPIFYEIEGNLNNFIENINCLRETYDFSKGMLNSQLQTATKLLADFISPMKVVDKEGHENLDIPAEKYKEFSRRNKKLNRAKKAILLIPPSYIVSLVSIFDTFMAGMVRCVYSLKPDLLLKSQMNFTYRQLAEYETLKEVKKNIIDNTIDKLFRDSHTEQMEWLEKAIEVNTLKQFAGWPSFIELTERRNLFVHADGIVSSQYLNECKKCKYNTNGIELGSKLTVDDEYFHKSFSLLYEMGIMLTQILINKLYLGIYTKNTGVRDKLLIGNVYELICEKHYDIAINVSFFARDTKVFKRTIKDSIFVELNLAQALKWSGKIKQCNDVLENLDTSALNIDLQIPKKVLEDDFDEVYRMMNRLGSNSSILTKEAYREWPIFKEIRKTEKFQEVFQDVFNEPLIIKNASAIPQIKTESITEESNSSIINSNVENNSVV